MAYKAFVVATHGWIARTAGKPAAWASIPSNVKVYAFVSHDVTLDGPKANEIVRNLIDGKVSAVKGKEQPSRMPDYTLTGTAAVVAEGWEMEPGIYKVPSAEKTTYVAFGNPHPHKGVGATDSFQLSDLFKSTSKWYLGIGTADAGAIYLATCKEVVHT